MAKGVTGALGEAAPSLKENKYFKAADKIATAGHGITQSTKNAMDSYNQAPEPTSKGEKYLNRADTGFEMAKGVTGSIGEVAPGLKNNKYFQAADTAVNIGHGITQAIKAFRGNEELDDLIDLIEELEELDNEVEQEMLMNLYTYQQDDDISNYLY